MAEDVANCDGDISNGYKLKMNEKIQEYYRQQDKKFKEALNDIKS